MCGVSAYFDLSKRQTNRNGYNDREQRRAKLAAQLDRSVESMRHRGPNAKGVWISPDTSAGLGHVRLSTRDLSSAGDQPLHSADPNDDIHVVVNGELYYDEHLRSVLGKEYRFQSNSDSEMAIALYRHYGTAFIYHLRGEFSLILYDAKKRMLVAARDRFGVKPLHYGVRSGRLLIATQCKGVAQLFDENDSLRWDAQCLAQGGGHYGDRTLFEGIEKFPPGHILVARKGQKEQLLFQPFFEIKFPPNEGGEDSRPAQQLIQELRALLLEAVKIRLDSSDVPVGILLSGGVDSSAVAGMAAHLIRQRKKLNNGAKVTMPRCFTIAFPDDDDLDESAIADRTAIHLGLPIDKVVVTEQMLADEFDEACWLGETLMWDLQHIAKKALSRHINKCGLKVVLNGDGSDELFGGYPYFVADRLEENDKNRASSQQSTSSTQREKLRQEHANNVKWFGMEQESDKRQNNKVAGALHLSPVFCNLAVSRHDSWLVDGVRNLSDPFEAISECFSTTEVEEMAKYHPLHRSMLAWSKTVLPNLVIAAISDGAEMAHGVESRPPFLDNVVAEYAHTLPVDMLVHLDGDNTPVEKWIFREAVKPYVTEEVYKRRKHAFAAPFRWARNGPLYNKLTSLITRENVEKLGFADWNKCADIVDRSFDEKDQLLFREAIWLAQIISIGLQFRVETLVSTGAIAGLMDGVHNGLGSGLTKGCTNGYINGYTNGYTNETVNVQRNGIYA